MKLSFDLAPLAFLGVGALFLLVAGGSYLLGSNVSTVVVAIGGVFILVAVATAIMPNE